MSFIVDPPVEASPTMRYAVGSISKQFTAVAALILPTAGVALANASSVGRVRDAGPIPAGIPMPAIRTAQLSEPGR